MDYANKNAFIFNKYATISIITNIYTNTYTNNTNTLLILMTTTQTQTYTKSDLTFNVFYKEDTTTKTFLQTLVSKNPWEWSMLRQAFEGKKDCVITLVDRYIETPFHCLLAVLFCKQVMEELGCSSRELRLILTPLKKEKPGQLTTVNSLFDTTGNRNEFLRECFMLLLGIEVSITTKRNPMHCRDFKISMEDYSLYIRCEGGIAKGWQPTNKYLAQLPAKELLELHQSDLPCSNVYVHGHCRNGVFISIELQPKTPTK